MIDLQSIPSKPGCYLFKDDLNIILYVGKAKDLKKRVSSYFQNKELDQKTRMLVSRIVTVDFIITKNEIEAFILENNLIKKHAPKYNIDLKDSKRYAYLEVTSEEFPRLILCRKREGKGSFYGPFVSASSRDYVLNGLIKTFQIRTCFKMPKKACLRYYIKLCHAPCIGNISKEDYRENIRKAVVVLRGHTDAIIDELMVKMKDASLHQNYELALELKNQLQALKNLGETQNMERGKKYDEDIINYIIKDNKVYLMLFNIAKGILENKHEFEFDNTENFLEEFIIQYYSDNKIPSEILLPEEMSDVLAAYLTEQSGARVLLYVPQKGEKKELLELVASNIQAIFFGETAKLEDLQNKLRLQSLPVVIECFDISHLSGTAMVASMVQFRYAKPDKSNYRKFKIQSVEGIDDFKAIGEVVRRRYTRLVREMAPLPDLVIIDGGKGQLHAALDELSALNIKMPVISLAKRFEDVYVPGLSNPLNIDKKSKALHLIQEVRDEAHRFAISYNKLLRKKEMLQ